MDNYKDFPREQYRLLLLDQGGERDKTEIYLTSEKRSQFNPEFPEINISDNNIKISNYLGKYNLWVYSDKNILIKETQDNKETLNLLNIVKEDKDQSVSDLSFYVSYYSDKNGLYLSSGPYFINEN